MCTPLFVFPTVSESEIFKMWFFISNPWMLFLFNCFRIKIKTSDLACQVWPLPTSPPLTPNPLPHCFLHPMHIHPRDRKLFWFSARIHIYSFFGAFVPGFPLRGFPPLCPMNASSSFRSPLQYHFRGPPFQSLPNELHSSSSAPWLPGCLHKHGTRGQCLSLLCPCYVPIVI